MDSTKQQSTAPRFHQKAAEWEDVFTAERGNVVCTVSKLAIKPRAKYSIRFGWKAQNDRVIVNLPMVIQGRGVVSVEAPDLAALNDVYQECWDWLGKHAQEEEDKWIAERQSRERRQLDREKPRQVEGIKSLGKKDFKKQLAERVQLVQETVIEAGEPPAVEEPAS